MIEAISRHFKKRNMARGREHASIWCCERTIEEIEKHLEYLDASLVESCRDSYDRGYMDVLREHIWADRVQP